MTQPYVPGPQHEGPRHSGRRKALVIAAAAAGALVAFSIGIAAGGGGKTTAAASRPAPTVTVTEEQYVPGPTVTATVEATANSQGQATQISDDGVYVVGQDIPGGTWHTIGGSQCYEATLSGMDTIGDDIISNNNFTGPDTVSLTGVKAFDINGGCTWVHRD